MLASLPVVGGVWYMLIVAVGTLRAMQGRPPARS
jgi:hypothetical protein